MKTIKWGIIGAGRISATFATALNSMEHTVLAAVASRDIERSKDFAVRYQVGKAYGSYEELVKDPEIDVIYIGTPHSEHKANAALCIMNGKAVLCEKPFTINASESEYLIQLAREKKVFLMEAMWTKFLPVNKEVKKLIAAKRIGDIKTLHITMGFKSEFDINNRLYNPATAGGALLDVGVYTITYAIQLLDMLPDQVTSCAIFGKSNVDEQNTVIFSYKEGIIANLNTSIVSNSGTDVVIIGDKGKIRIPVFWKAEYAEVFGEDGKLEETIAIPFMKNGYEYEAEEVNQCLREGKLESDQNPLKGTLDIIRIMDQIRAEWGLTYPQEEK